MIAVDPPRSITWTGRMPGINGVHVWELTETDGRTSVHTEEGWDGILPKLLRRRSQQMLEASLSDTVTALKQRVEMNQRG